MVELQQHPDGIVFKVRVHAGARTNALHGEHDGALKITVTQAPEKGKANKAIVELLAKQLGLRKSQIEILAGHTAAQKQVLVRDISLEELNRVLNS